MHDAPPDWHLLTGEYPPQPGGVGDYTRLVAEALARTGASVHVWATGPEGVTDEAGVTVHRAPRLFTSGLPGLTRALDACRAPRRLLLQYVPHAFGMKAMNLPFCAWFASRRHDERWVLFHEVVYPFESGAPLRRHVLAGVTHAMARWVASTADRVFVSIPSWAAPLPGDARRRAEWRPVPSNLPTQAPEDRVREARAALGTGPVLGHFGTYGPSITGLLEPLLVRILSGDTRRLAVLLGRGSLAYRAALAERHPELADQLRALDALAPADAAVHLKACDVLLQPYPDGVSSRRGSAMAGLGLGMPLVTNTGHLTEPLWRELRPVEFTEGHDPIAMATATERLLRHPDKRHALATRAAEVYQAHFALERTLEALFASTTKRPVR
ncbi:hypothetical protein DRW03_27720 [Corallococcus sp. H22C18031201]|nr:hypothetical protein DRW03_27720 [Corallococcus sp. H22C18031201]